MNSVERGRSLRGEANSTTMTMAVLRPLEAREVLLPVSADRAPTAVQADVRRTLRYTPLGHFERFQESQAP